MHFVRSATHESWERELLPSEHGKRYAPLTPAPIYDRSIMSTLGVQLMQVDGAQLAIEPETASWSFLSAREAALFRSLHGRPFGELRQRWPLDAQASAKEFVNGLYRRGLVFVDGHRSVDPAVFADGPNTTEPHLVELLVTEKCNLACPYCLAGATPKMPSMSEEIGKRAIDLAFAMEEAPSFNFEFSGGEPFLRFDLMRTLTEHIQKHPQRKGRPVKIGAQTNATLLTEERLRWAKDNEITIGVSLDGDPQSHDMSRPQVNGRSSFGKVIQGLDLLQRLSVPFGVLVVLNRSNVHSAQALVDFLVDNGLHSVKINPIAFLGAGRQNWDAFGLTDDEVVNYFVRFAELVVEQRHPIYEATLATMFQHLVSKQRQNRCMRGHCGAGTSFQCINAEGQIFPCGRATQSEALAFGDVLTSSGSLSQLARKNSYVQQIAERRPHDVECGSCPVRQMCQAGCAVQAFERFGTVKHKTPECSFFKTLYPKLMRWLSYDGTAFDHLNRVGYFQAPAERIDWSILPEQHAPPPTKLSAAFVPSPPKLRVLADHEVQR